MELKSLILLSFANLWSTNILLTESEVFYTGKIQAETVTCWPRYSKAEVWYFLVKTKRNFRGYALFLQARNQPLGITGE